jgi:hypothetical protein
MISLNHLKLKLCIELTPLSDDNHKLKTNLKYDWLKINFRFNRRPLKLNHYT